MSRLTSRNSSTSTVDKVYDIELRKGCGLCTWLDVSTDSSRKGARVCCLVAIVRIGFPCEEMVIDGLGLPWLPVSQTISQLSIEKQINNWLERLYRTNGASEYSVGESPRAGYGIAVRQLICYLVYKLTRASGSKILSWKHYISKILSISTSISMCRSLIHWKYLSMSKVAPSWVRL